MLGNRWRWITTLSIVGLMLAGCGGTPEETANRNIPSFRSARALSNHYVEVLLSAVAGEDAEVSEAYRILAADGSELPVLAAQLVGDGDRMVLMTGAQTSVDYTLSLEPSGSSNDPSADPAASLVGGVLFSGSVTAEPRLTNAVALSNTSVLLTFDVPMNNVTAEMKELYRIIAPSEFPEANVQVTAATLGEDAKSVELTTTPQANVEYSVQVSLLEAKYQPGVSCNGEFVNFVQSPQTNCVEEMRLFNEDGYASSVVASARIQVNPSQQMTAEASGVTGRVNLWQPGGIGVKSAACGTTEILPIEGSGANSDEEVTLDLDYPVQCEAIVLKLTDAYFPSDDPVVFVSSDTANGFDHSFDDTAIEAATLAISTSESYLFLGDIGLPPGTMVDRIRLRETRGLIGIGSICLTGKNYIDPTQASATFLGIPPFDDVEPRITGAAALDAETVLVNFSEPVGDSGGDPTNYSFSPALTIMGAVLNGYKTQVQLTTLPMTLGEDYTVTGTSDITDRATPANILDGAFNSATFTFDGTLGAGEDPSQLLPRVTGAISTSNRTVVVSFNKAMSDSVLDASNYFIVQENVNSEVGYIAVTDAAFLRDNRTSVILSTTSQNEVTYRLTVVNVEDMQGNALAPKELLVDPASVLFPGSPATCGPKRCSADSINPGGIDSNGACEVDADCDGTCEDPCETIDTDGDGLSDAAEQNGWTVAVELATKRGEHNEREVIRTQVTSSPLVADTDRDGLDDATEKRIGSNPRSADTDNDQLSDEEEFNLYYSNPLDQDSDDDDTDDYLEATFYFTSPIMPDTDGDQLGDSEELYELSRNPLIADLPLPQITVADIELALNITSSYTDEQGTTRSLSESTSSTFTQSRTNSIGTSDTKTTQNEATFGQSIGFEGGSAGWKISGNATFGQSQARGFSSTVDRQSSQTSQQEYQESVTSAIEESERRSVTREINSAIVQATVNIANQSDLAFSITNLEVSLLQQDRLTGLTFRPIASMKPTGGADVVFNLAPLEQERGPIIFENTEVFPNRIDALMREPTGLVFQVVNFDVLDEAGRNLVFTSQDVADRTAGITIDFGDGRVESYRVATASVFGDDGFMVGITMQRALEIIGILKDDVLLNDDNNTYETAVETRTINSVATPVEALVRIRDVRNTTDGKKFWAAVSSNTNLSESANFSSIPLKAHDSILLLYTSDEDGDGLFVREEYLYGSDDTLVDSDGDSLDDYDEVRVGWTVEKVPGLPYKTFPSPARPDSDLDGLEDDEEQFNKTDPNRADTDEDGLTDPIEVNDTYTIALFDGDLDLTNTVVLTVYPYSDQAIVAGSGGVCNTTATGDDVALTAVSGSGSKLCVESGPNGIIDSTPGNDDLVVAAPKIDPGPDGICNSGPVAGDDVLETAVDAAPIDRGSLGKVCVSAGLNDMIDTPVEGDDFLRVTHKGLFGTDPVRFDTDLDGIGDGREALLGTNPNTRDAGSVIDSDGDGLYDQEEEDGWIDRSTGMLVTSNKSLSDTDFDGIPDVIERALGSNPRSLDTDGDTLLDIEEFDSSDPTNIYDAVQLATALQQCNMAENCSYVAPQPSQITSTDVADSDTDGDTRNDNVELEVGWSVAVYNSTAVTVFSDPRYADFDNDGLDDAGELLHTTDPNNPDTDDDLRNDGAEVTAMLDPLRKDKKISVTLVNVDVIGDCDDPSLEGLELEGTFKLTKPDGSDVNLHDFGCQAEEGACGTRDCCMSEDPSEVACEGESFSVNATSSDFVFRDGETFILKSDSLKDHDNLECGAHELDDTIGSINESVDFNVSLQTTKAVPVGSSDSCKITVNYTFNIVN